MLANRTGICDTKSDTGHCRPLPLSAGPLGVSLSGYGPRTRAVAIYEHYKAR